jgi:uncharacterized protein YgiB involved in biofilm formation
MKLALVPLLLLAACAPITESQGAKAANLKVQGALADFEAASRAGDPLDMCVKAKIVAVAYEDARQAASAQAWRAREKEACQLAMDALGVRRPAADD